ncbi:hypothetical protein CSUI_006505 [Cystoisospora suis]|uniref:Transmembrane protein n=1 Tax=Cystoisospora suis TaxID=483139 RepID=A0A2C6KU91_9APIC|nr:hypothetical protein CSUI_006505 [Cystoisospora suis]
MLKRMSGTERRKIRKNERKPFLSRILSETPSILPLHTLSHSCVHSSIRWMTFASFSFSRTFAPFFLSFFLPLLLRHPPSPALWLFLHAQKERGESSIDSWSHLDSVHHLE